LSIAHVFKTRSELIFPMKATEAYQQKRRADLAAMQVDMELSKALEPVDDVVTAAQDSCKG